MAPALSFVIPVRNDASYLRRCLASIQANGTAIDTEVIVADNGSTDDSAAVGRAAGASVLHLPNRRVAVVRNDAAKAAAADWIAFIDADNELAPGWVAAATDAIRDPAVAIAGAQYRAPEDGTWVQRTYDLLRGHQPGTRIVGWLPSGNIVIRRSAFEDAGGFDPSLETCEDVDLCRRVAQRGGRILAVDGMRSTHHGDPRTLTALFRGELWRGRDSLRVSLRPPIALKSVVGAGVPLVTLSALSASVMGLIALPFGGWKVAAGGLLWILLLTLLRASVLIGRAPAGRRGIGQFGQAWLVAIGYDVARALALVARTGHNVRQRASILV